MNIINKKKILRKKIKYILNNTKHEEFVKSGKKFAIDILSWLSDLKCNKKEINVAFFSSMQDEISTKAVDILFMNMNYNRFLPVINNEQLLFKEVPKNIRIENLIKSDYKISIPHKNSNEININELDVLIIPGLAFDLSGNRLGRGRGYYDKTLLNIHKNNKKPKIICIGLDFQLINEVYIEKFDYSVEWIYTPHNGFIRSSKDYSINN